MWSNTHEGRPGGRIKVSLRNDEIQTQEQLDAIHSNYDEEKTDRLAYEDAQYLTTRAEGETVPGVQPRARIIPHGPNREPERDVGLTLEG